DCCSSVLSLFFSLVFSVSSVSLWLFSRHQFEDVPQRGIISVGKIAADAERLVAEFGVVDDVEDAETRMLLGIEAVQRRGEQKHVEAIPANHTGAMHEDFFRPMRGVFRCAIDLRLQDERFVVVGSGGRQEVKLMTVPAGAMAGAGVARVEPQ